jgi:hypothetical protein
MYIFFFNTAFIYAISEKIRKKPGGSIITVDQAAHG